MAEWRWEPHPDDLLSTYRPRRERNSRGGLMITYLTDVRGERVVVLQVTWFG